MLYCTVHAVTSKSTRRVAIFRSHGVNPAIFDCPEHRVATYDLALRFLSRAEGWNATRAAIAAVAAATTISRMEDILGIIRRAQAFMSSPTTHAVVHFCNDMLGRLSVALHKSLAFSTSPEVCEEYMEGILAPREKRTLQNKALI